VIDGQTLHPNMQLLLAATRHARRAQSLSADDVNVARRRMFEDATRFRREAPEVARFRELTIPAAHGSLRAWHYAPESSQAEPLLVFLHGGGFALGSLETHDQPCRQICKDARVHVLSVEYRLAPEHPYPAAVDDAIAALRYAQREAPALGADPARIGIGGDSAGGQLSAVVAQRTRSDNPPRLQVLLYPTVDIGGSEWRSRALFRTGFLLSAEDIRWFDQQYTQGKDGRKDPGLAPFRADDLSGLCPAIVLTCGFDPLRDEGEAYAEALEKAGNRVVAWRETGLIHGFAHMAVVSRVADEAMHRLAAKIGEMLRS
jgi:acetyl esterase